jgi:hypothetical protein
MPMANAETQRRRKEYLQLAEELQRRNGVPRFKNGAEMLRAWRDLFDSDEEMEEFGRYVQRMREEERAGTATDQPWPASSSIPTWSRCTARVASRPGTPAR